MRAGRYDAAGPVLCQALLEWLDDEDRSPSFLARLGLPATRLQIRNALRDFHLVAAAELLAPDASLAVRAHVLMEAVDLFARLRWAAWQNTPTAPSGASQAEQHLHAAFMAHGYRRRNGDQHCLSDWSETYYRRILE